MRIGIVGRAAAVAILVAMGAGESAGAQMRLSECASEFSRDDGDGDGRLAGGEAKRYRRVMMYVDMDGDGAISNDEFMGACAEGVFARMYRDQH